MTKHLTLLLFIGLAWGQNPCENEQYVKLLKKGYENLNDKEFDLYIDLHAECKKYEKNKTKKIVPNTSDDDIVEHTKKLRSKLKRERERERRQERESRLKEKPIEDEIKEFAYREYPNDYKTYQTKIIKFDRDYQHELEYTFYGLFPYDLVSTQVAYQSSDILKATCSFYYDRYVCGKFDSYSVHRGTSNNKEGTANNDSGLPGRLEDPTTPLGRATQAAIGPYESGRDILGDSLSDTFVGEARRNRL